MSQISVDGFVERAKELEVWIPHVFGHERELHAGLERLRSIGVTDFDANILAVDEETHERMLDYLESRVGR